MSFKRSYMTGFLVASLFSSSSTAQEPPARPYVPEIQASVLDEVKMLVPLASRYSQFDFTNAEQVDAAFNAQQRLRAIGDMVEWSLLRLYETSEDENFRRDVLLKHMRSTYQSEQMAYGLWLTRNTVRRALSGTGLVRLHETGDAADYISFWGQAEDLPLLEQLANDTSFGEAGARRFASPLDRLKMRVTQKLPPGETDKVSRPRKPFHDLGIAATSVEPLKRMVTRLNKTDSERKNAPLRSMPPSQSDSPEKSPVAANAPALKPPASEAHNLNHPPNEEPTSSTPWGIIVVLIVAVAGLLGLLFKRRS